MCIFQIDLFSAIGPLPQTLFEIPRREQDIRYSSRTRLNTDQFKEVQTYRRAIKRIERKLPADLKDTVDWKLLAQLGCDAAITIVHLIHRKNASSTQSMDYEFSRYTMEERWQAGSDDVQRTLSHPDWIGRKRPDEGVTVLDLTREYRLPHAKPKAAE